MEQKLKSLLQNFIALLKFRCAGANAPPVANLTLVVQKFKYDTKYDTVSYLN